MMKLAQFHRPLTALALVGGAVAVVPATAGTAAADSICASGYYNTRSENFYDNSGHLAAVGSIFSYRWGTCADLVAEGAYVGVSKYMSITTYSDNGTSASDAGNYRYYAGPVNLPDSVDGLCATTHVVMHYPNGAAMIDTSGPDSICG
jgi:hypothetical protein